MSHTRKVIFVGDKPSKKNTDSEVAFIGTQSYKRLLEWIDFLDIEDYTMINRVSPLFVQKVLHYKNEGWDVVALGREAHIALQNIGVGHCALPHPSGRNRWLNDKESVRKCLETCKAYIT